MFKADPPLFRAIEKKSVVEAVRQQLLSLIREGKLKPGTKLPPERELLVQFDVSRPALREAIHTLVGLGLFDVRRGQGMTDNIVNYFYVHNLFNSWFTTAGLGLALYLLPQLTDKPLYSQRLGWRGLWSVWTGEHHQLSSPAPDWLEYLTIVFSMLAAVPTIAFLVNFFTRMRGRGRAWLGVALEGFSSFWRLLDFLFVCGAMGRARRTTSRC
jgi:Cytochrome C and Quinol oxidase polypeptide I/Bacterial regulatory proteins, gntR family